MLYQDSEDVLPRIVYDWSNCPVGDDYYHDLVIIMLYPDKVASQAPDSSDLSLGMR